MADNGVDTLRYKETIFNPSCVHQQKNTAVFKIPVWLHRELKCPKKQHTTKEDLLLLCEQVAISCLTVHDKIK